MSTLRYPLLSAQVIAWSGILAACSAAYAQSPSGTADGGSAATSAAAAKADAVRESTSDKDSVTLSPFEVRAELDDGFAAIAAGDGTRLGLEMRDMPAAYMSITRDFMDSLALTDLQAASSWATNSGVTIDPQGSDVFPNVGGFLQRMRGIVVTGGQQRDFYNNPGFMDSYSLERVDFGRGPNAALFNPGLITGSSDNALAGATSAQSKRARPGHPFQTVRFRVGSWDYYRTEADVNQPITDKLAVRMNGVWFDRDGWRRGEFEKVHGGALSATYRVAEKTEIRLAANVDSTQRNNPGFDVWDQISGWDGLTVLDGPLTNAQFSANGTPGAALGNGRTLTFNGEPQGVNRRGGVYYVYVPGSGMVMNRQNEGVTRRGDETARTPIYGPDGAVYVRGTGRPFGNGGSAGTLTPSPTSNPDTNIDFRDAINLPPERFDRAIASSGFRMPARNFALTTNRPLVSQWNRDLNVAFTHQIARDWFIEVGADINKTHNKHMGALFNSWARTAIDINRFNPDGSPNPYFLQPYNDAPLRERHRFIENQSVRANLARNLDLGQLGTYQFNLNVGSNVRYTDDLDMFYSLGMLPDPRMAGGSDEQIRTRFYWNNPDLSYSPDSVPSTIFRRDFAANNNTWTTGTQTVNPRWVPTFWSKNKEKIDYVSLATAARYFDNKLVFVLAPRFDRYSQHLKQAPVFGDLPTDWDQTALQIFKPDAPADYATLTYNSVAGGRGLAATTRPRQNTINPATGLPYTNNNGVQDRNPAYANYRFRDDYSPPAVKGDNVSGSYGIVYRPLSWLALTTNYASSYATPLTNAFDLRGQIVTPRTGTGWDFGTLGEFFDRRLTVKLSYFTNQEENVRIDPPIKGPINSLLSRNAATDATTDGRNQRGISDLIGTDYQSQKTSGFEFEVVGRITKNWRILANVGTSRVVTFDRYNQALAYLDENSDLFVQVLEDAGGMLDTTQHPNGAPGVAVVNPAVTPLVPAERDNAIRDFNNIWTQAGFILNDKALAADESVVLNLNTDYTFDRTFLKGLRLGTAVQWKGKSFIGYRTADTVVDSAGNVILAYPDGASNDNRLFFRLPVDVSATASYRWRLKHRREVEVALVVRNVLGGDAEIYAQGSIIARPTNGDFTSPTRTSVPGRLGGYQVPRSFLLTTTLRF